MIVKILRTEALFVLLAAISTYFYLGFYWLPLVLLLLFPDLFMVGYLKNNSFGAHLYNLGHTYVLPIILLGGSVLWSWRAGTIIGLIWVAHIAMDRTLGYGLKQITGFQDTHLGRIGQNHRSGKH